MKAELLKDCYLLRRFWALYLIAVAAAFLQKPLNLAALYAGYIPAAIMISDMRSGWGEYSKILPRKESAYALSKYIIGATLGLSAAVLRLAVYALQINITGGPAPFMPERIILFAAIDILIVTGYSAVTIPSALAFGLSGFGLFIFSFSAVMAIPLYIWQSALYSERINLPGEKSLTAAAIVFLAAVFLYISSAALSCILSKKHLQPKKTSEIIV